MDQPITRFVAQQPGHGDCGVAALAMCLGLSYPEALVLVAAVCPNVLRDGVRWQDLRRAARRRSVTFKVVTKGIDPEDEDVCGILAVEFPLHGALRQHAVWLKRGLIFDGRTESVWDADCFLKAHNADVVSLLVRTA